MNLKTFLQTYNVTHFEIIPNLLIVSVVINNDIVYDLNTDTSNIEAGTLLVRTSEYSINNDILSINTLFIDTRTVEVLSM
jgi:hypothetical protein